MFGLGMTEESTSSWRNAFRLVPKPDGSICLCIDFQGMKVVSDFDAYPMLQGDALLDQVEPAQHLSTLDLTKEH